MTPQQKEILIDTQSETGDHHRQGFLNLQSTEEGTDSLQRKHN